MSKKYEVEVIKELTISAINDIQSGDDESRRKDSI